MKRFSECLVEEAVLDWLCVFGYESLRGLCISPEGLTPSVAATKRCCRPTGFAVNPPTTMSCPMICRHHASRRTGLTLPGLPPIGLLANEVEPAPALLCSKNARDTLVVSGNVL